MRGVPYGGVQGKAYLLVGATLRAGIDGACWTNRRGYGRFLREILPAAVRADSDIRYTMFLDREAPPEFPLPEGVRAVVVRTSESVNEAAHAGGRRSIPDVLRMSAAVIQEELDVFFFPSVYSYFPLLRPLPMLLGVHDTLPEQRPEMTFQSRREQRFWNWKMRLALKQASRVLTVSEHSRWSIERDLRWPASKTDVIYEAAHEGYRPGAGRGNYVLHVGGISPNKNLARLVRAFSRVRRAVPGLKLVLAGDYESDGFKSSYAELRGVIADEGVAEAVEFAGYVPEAELPGLYAGAALLAFPSLEEGFGLPAVEAMSCGVPVVASRGHALKEVVGGAGLLVDPLSVEAIAGAMELVLTDASLAEELRAKSLARAAKFSWEQGGRELVRIMRGLKR